jgi:CheY-like chemotaxis protein
LTNQQNLAQNLNWSAAMRIPFLPLHPPRRSTTQSRALESRAEDDASIRHLLVDAMTADGFEVSAAANGVEALDMFHEAGPWDVVLSDDEMPGLTGRQLLSRLRGEGAAVPALILSGSLSLSAAEQIALGVGAVLSKPFRIREVLNALREAAAAA